MVSGNLAWTPQPTSFPFTERQHKVVPSLREAWGVLLLVPFPPQARRANWCHSPPAPASSSFRRPHHREDRHFHVEALVGNLTRDPLHLGRPGANSLWLPPKVCQGGSRVAVPPSQRGPVPSTRKAWFCTGLGSAST